MATAKNRLHVRRLQTVGFVDKGDNPAAEVLFFKRREIEKMIKEEGGKFCVYSEDGKKLGEHDTREKAEAQLRAVEANKKKLPADGAGGGSPRDDGTPTGGAAMPGPFDVKKLDAEAQAEFKKLTDKVAELEAEVAKGKPKDEPKLPEAVQKQLDAAAESVKKAEERVQKLEDEREHERFITKARALDLPPDDFAVPLRKIAGALTPEEYGKVEQHLKALNARARTAALYSEIGKGGDAGAATEAEQQVETAVKDVMAKNPTWKRERAYGEVMKSRPDLRNQLEAERVGRTPQPQED